MRLISVVSVLASVVAIAGCGSQAPPRASSSARACIDVHGNARCAAAETGAWCQRQFDSGVTLPYEQALACSHATRLRPPGLAPVRLVEAQVADPARPKQLTTPVKRAAEAALGNQWDVRVYRATLSRKSGPPAVYVLYLNPAAKPWARAADLTDSICNQAMAAAEKRLEKAQQDAQIRCLPERWR